MIKLGPRANSCRVIGWMLAWPAFFACSSDPDRAQTEDASVTPADASHADASHADAGPRANGSGTSASTSAMAGRTADIIAGSNASKPPALPSSSCASSIPELPAVYASICNTCHTASGAPNTRYPDLYEFSGTLDDFTQHVRAGSSKGMPAYPAGLVSDGDVASIYHYFTGGHTRPADSIDLGSVVPLYAAPEAVYPPIVFTREDGVLITRGAGRVRGRHEGPLDTNQPFMEFVADYFLSRTYGFIVEDFTVLGQSKIRVTYLPISMPTTGTNFRSWKNYGNGDVFNNNAGMMSDMPLPSLAIGGNDLTASYATKLAPYARVQQQVVTTNARTKGPIQAGDLFEFEFGIFNDANAIKPAGSRTAYYTDTFRYRVGKGGLTPDNPDPYTDNKGITGPEAQAQQGGDTTNVWAYFMPETQFGQMALNIQHENVQRFVEGRRLFHTDFATGDHTEPGNPTFLEQKGKAGPLGLTASCESCHQRNGAGVTLEGPLGPTSSMAIKLYGDAAHGNQLQLKDGTAVASGSDKRQVMLGDGTSVTLSKPKLTVTMKSGAASGFSARIARKVIGMGLLEAIDEATLLTRADAKDCNADGISGRPSYVKDPANGVMRVGRFGWKAEKISVEHQIAEALFDDMGVGTKLFPDAGKTELADEDLSRLVTYMRLVAVPAQRDHGDAQAQRGEQIFKTVGCANCHVTDVVTGVNHPFLELRNQAIKPYSDLLLHDLGPDLADDSGIAAADAIDAPPSASEWRTPPLWGTGLLDVINGHRGLLHDGRAANVLEAVLWHGGEAEPTKQRVLQLTAAEREALVTFVMSL
jgi:CxxC motif-containing protein (DUF1111 family)